MLAAGQVATRSTSMRSGSSVDRRAYSPALVVEDLDRSDRAARDALAYLVTQVDVGGWAVATYRYEVRLAQTEPVLVRRRARCARFCASHWGRSPAGQVAEQVAEILGAAADIAGGGGRSPAECGIPLLVEEVIAAAEIAAYLMICGVLLSACRSIWTRHDDILRVIAVAGDSRMSLSWPGRSGWMPARSVLSSGTHVTRTY